MKKNSKRKEEIFEALRKRNDHPTVAMLYEDLKKAYPNIGIATVYRNLLSLYNEGRIIKINSKDGMDRFDGNMEPHIHFECKKCGKIEDIFLSECEKKEYNKNLEQWIKTISGTYINSIIKIQGSCKKCINDNTPLNN